MSAREFLQFSKNNNGRRAFTSIWMPGALLPSVVCQRDTQRPQQMIIMYQAPLRSERASSIIIMFISFFIV